MNRYLILIGALFAFASANQLQETTAVATTKSPSRDELEFTLALASEEARRQLITVETDEVHRREGNDESMDNEGDDSNTTSDDSETAEKSDEDPAEASSNDWEDTTGGDNFDDGDEDDDGENDAQERERNRERRDKEKEDRKNLKALGKYIKKMLKALLKLKGIPRGFVSSAANRAELLEKIKAKWAEAVNVDLEDILLENCMYDGVPCAQVTDSRKLRKMLVDQENLEIDVTTSLYGADATALAARVSSFQSDLVNDGYLSTAFNSITVGGQTATLSTETGTTTEVKDNSASGLALSASLLIGTTFALFSVIF